jgi:hypothetical protein
MVKAYVVPALNIAGEVNTAEYNVEAPLENPAIVVVVNTVEVGRPPAVVLTSTIMSGFDPPHRKQKRLTSSRESCPLTVGTKV